MQRIVCSESATRCLSKSYIALPVPVVEIEIAGDVSIHGGLEWHEIGVIACATQSFGARFGEVLVLPNDCLRHVNIFDVHRPAKRVEHGANHVAEAFGLAGSDVENAVYPRCVQQPAQNGNGVININEITALVAIGNTLTTRFEQTDRLACPGKIENLGQNTGHVAFVILVRSIDIEKLEADPM